VALTNAEKQARWRARRDERLAFQEKRIAELQAEVAALKAKATIERPGKRKRSAKQRKG
jgi:uncharacterized coiled-coil protein SlyX